MEVTLIGSESIRIKGKNAALVVNPVSIKTKTTADAVLLLENNLSSGRQEPDLSKIEEYRLEVVGTGEYEVSGAKISSFSDNGNLSHIVSLDGSGIFVTSCAHLSQNKKELDRDCPIVALFCNSVLDSSVLADLSPSLILLYGEHAEEVAKGLGKEVVKTTKYSVTADKLPEEMQLIVLGQ